MGMTVDRVAVKASCELGYIHTTNEGFRRLREARQDQQ